MPGCWEHPSEYSPGNAAIGVRGGAGCAKRHKPPVPSRLRLPQTHLKGENSCGARRLLGHIPAQLCFSHILPGAGGMPRSGGTLRWALCRGGPCRVGNHVALGLGALREARVEARGSSHPPGMPWPGFSSDRAPKAAAPWRRRRPLPGRRGVTGGDEEPPSLPGADGPSAAKLPLPHRLPGPAV